MKLKATIQKDKILSNRKRIKNYNTIKVRYNK